MNDIAIKHRLLKTLHVLQQYDYDSSTVRKRTFQEALVSITLPFIKKNLADTCKPVSHTHQKHLCPSAPQGAVRNAAAT